MRLTSTLIASIGAAAQAYDLRVGDSSYWCSGCPGPALADAILTYQRPAGGWPKNQDPQPGDVYSGIEEYGCLDNGATVGEIRYMAQAYKETGVETYKNSAANGIAFVLASQYQSSGGWPQYWPLRGGYRDAITYNDNLHINIMKLLNEISSQASPFDIAPFNGEASAAQAAHDKAMQCILDTQILTTETMGGLCPSRVNWCAQHDPLTLEAAHARNYEPASYSGNEGMKIAQYLMDIENPSEDMKQAIVGAYVWAKKSVLMDYVEERDANNNKILTYSAGAELWPRFATLPGPSSEESKVIFCDRGCVDDASLMYTEYTVGFSQMDPERRNGYTWLGSWGSAVITKFENEWSALHPNAWPGLDDCLAGGLGLATANPTRAPTILHPCSGECIARCVDIYGGDGSSGASYMCSKGCAGMSGGQVSNPDKFCNKAESERYSYCLGVCEGASSNQDRIEQCKVGCQYWEVAVGTVSPTKAPSASPTSKPTSAPTPLPTSSPSARPSYAPTSTPTNAPTPLPTSSPSARPSYAPTSTPTPLPTSMPVQPAYHVLHPQDLPPPNLSASRPAPLKGFLTSPEWLYGGYLNPQAPAADAPDATMEYYYLGLSEVMNGMTSFPGFDTVVEPRIAASAGRGKHAVIRFYMDYPRADWASYISHTPAFLKVEPYNVTMTDWTTASGSSVGQSPDYSDPNLVQALTNFIAALGERYDGDPRVGFVQLGLLGFWGEWHTYTGDATTNDWIPDQTKKDVIDAFDNAFQTTQMQVRYPHPHAAGRERFGLHDDSFAHSTVDEGVYGSPMDWFFWPKVQNANMADFWRKGSMGGELRPELQATIFDADYPAGTEYHQDYGLCSETTHATFMLNHKAYSPGYIGDALERAKAANDRMGYAYRISAVAASKGNVVGTVDIVATVRQDGIAEFYYDLDIAMTCEGYTATLPGVETIADEGSFASFTFAGVPDTELCLSAIDFSLTSSYALAGAPVKFAQGDVDGTTVRVAVPTSPVPATPPPTASPSPPPTASPSSAPSNSPSKASTKSPSESPTPRPTDAPIPAPTSLSPTAKPTNAPSNSNICSGGCIERCIDIYGGDGSSGASYMCSKGCAGMSGGQVSNPDKYCNKAESERYSYCLGACESASSDETNRERCRVGCQYWEVAVGTDSPTKAPSPTPPLSTPEPTQAPTPLPTPLPTLLPVSCSAYDARETCPKSTCRWTNKFGGRCQDR